MFEWNEEEEKNGQFKKVKMTIIAIGDAGDAILSNDRVALFFMLLLFFLHIFFLPFRFAQPQTDTNESE